MKRRQRKIYKSNKSNNYHKKNHVQITQKSIFLCHENVSSFLKE